MIRKTIALACLLLACSMGYADSLERFVNRYKEKEGAVCRVFNKDRHFNDVPEEDVSPEAQRLVSHVSEQAQRVEVPPGCHYLNHLPQIL